VTSLLASVRERQTERSGLTFTDWYNLVVGGYATTWTTDRADTAPWFADLYARNPVVFSAVLARIDLYAEVRFAYQRLRNGRGGDLFTNRDLALIQNPAPGMTTGDLLARWEFDRSTAGNAFAFNWQGRIVIPRPERVEVMVTELRRRPGDPPFATDLLGYRIYDDTVGAEALLLLAEDVAHLKGPPMPGQPFMGMSWIQAVRDDVDGDLLVTRHKAKYFENAATPNMVVQSPNPLTDEQFDRLRDMVERRYQGVENAHKTLLLEGGASAQVVGSDLTKATALGTMQDHYESRVSMASQVPAPVLGVLLGQNPTYNNYETALRHFIDFWARPSWRRTAEALQSLVRTPPDARLWFDDRDVAALRTDSMALAKIRSQDAQTARTLIDGGYEPTSVSQFLISGDPNDLAHTGTLSVQLQPPGTGTEPDNDSDEDSAPPEEDDSE
jgi:HK97 family phage portal protein